MRIFILLILVSSTAIGQTAVLPKGIGIFLFGYRQMAPQTQAYNAEGQLEPLARPLQKDFSGPKLLEGVGGTQLKELARHLQKFDSYSDADNSLLNTLSLGQLDGHVNGQISGQSFGLGFGINRRLTAFIGIPFITAKVNTEIQFSGQNNAQQIKQRLGSVAFQELQDGLDQATQITTNQIKQTIAQEGYAPLDEWSHSGIGDISFGAIYGFNLKSGYRHINSKMAVETTLSIPTGYVEDPNILTDTSFGSGYYSLTGKLKKYYLISERFIFNGTASVGLNAPTSLEKRVPEGEEGIIAQERLTTVDLIPGQDFQFTGTTGLKLGVASILATVGRKTHLKDQYTGSIEGNYEALAATSAKSQTFFEFEANVSTVELFQNNQFAIPLLVGAKYHMPIVAKNYIDERYFEVSLSSFFSTPMAKPMVKKKSRGESFAKKKRRKAQKKARRLSQKRSMMGHHH